MGNRKWQGVPPALRGAPSAAFLALILSCFLAGCAAPGEPYERKPPTPMAVTDLTAVQTGNDVVLAFTVPQQALDRRPLNQLPTVEIYRDIDKSYHQASAPPQAPASGATPLITIPAAMVPNYVVQGRFHFSDPLGPEDFVPQSESAAFYFVATRVSEKKSSAMSNTASVRIYPAALPIADLKTEVTHAAVVLSWTPPDRTLSGSAPSIAIYHVYRGVPEPGAAVTQGMKLKSPLVKIGESQSPSFQDTQFEFGQAYVYSVRSGAQYSGQTLESGDSNLVVVTPKDVFPPAKPQGLLVVLVPAQGEVAAHLELSWAINPETDISGYNVYRGEQAGAPGNRLNTELLPTPAFRDMNVQPGHRYFYSVTARDRAGNESPFSEIVAGEVPAENQVRP